MKISNRVAATGVLLLIAAVAAAAYTWNHLRPIWSAQKAVKSLLKDPESALFSDMTISPDGSVICGYVNAKNSMGGYAGPRHFVSFGEYALIDLELEINAYDSEQLVNDKKGIHKEYLDHVRRQCNGES